MGLLSYFSVISHDEAERLHLATREQRLEDDADCIKMVQQREALKKIAKAEKIKIQNRKRQRSKRQCDQAQKEDPSNAKTAELSCPRQLFKEDAAKNRDVRGQKHEHKATDAKLNNWVNPLLWQQIVNAGHEAGPQLSPTEIVKILKARNLQNFSKLTPQVLGCYIERPLNNNGSCTFEVEGSKQVAVTSKEEKRAWTAVVGVTAAGNVLPMQIVMKGGSQHSLPSSNSLDYAESKELGLLFGLNAKNYWSNIPLLEEYLKKIVTPHFSMQKQRLGYPEDQECVVLLDCWLVHRSEEF
ncbi:hypothetical protein EWM64_g7306 [Hericium alpestre]|uniref:DDE-1 domain-containing protein n=1 Tax=Hericium alpestre TaxID=135208 RepID=A0A4Y9ZP91_9AGAM|nr:hypothetical protein EWM64_g7306 [Hericium alpestre]